MALGLAATLVAGAIHRWEPTPVRGHATGEARIVSLSPAVTETLFALGVGAQVVGRSDFCTLPPDATHLPTVGTGLTPAYESIVRLQPTHIFTSASASDQRAGLGEIGPTTSLPWLTLEEVTSSVRSLGSLTGRTREGQALAQSLESALKHPPPADGPRVLLLMGAGGPDEASLFYVKPGSLHGRAMHAAGLRNAIEDHKPGAPTISLEGLMALDPDIILTMVPTDDLSPDARADLVKRFHNLTGLRAVRDGQVGVLAGSGYFSMGPTILSLVDALKEQKALLTGAGATGR